MRIRPFPRPRWFLAAGAIGTVGLLAGCNALVPTTAMRAARTDHTATLLVSGRVLVAGGRASGGALATAERYDPASSRWFATASLHAARYLHQAVRLSSGQVLVTGGFGTGGSALSSAERYQPGADTWRDVASSTVATGDHRTVTLADGRVLAVGPGHGTGQLYDPVANRWTSTGPKATRAWQNATLLPGGKVLVVGGDDIGYVDADTWRTRAEVYDPAIDRWRQVDPLDHRAAVTARLGPRVLAVGWVIPRDFGDETIRASIFDPVTGRWTGAETLGFGLDHDYTLTTLADGRAFLFGQANVLGQSIPVATVYGRDGRLQPVGNEVEERNGHAAARLDDGRVLVSGGLFGGFDFSDPDHPAQRPGARADIYFP